MRLLEERIKEGEEILSVESNIALNESTKCGKKFFEDFPEIT